MKIKTDLHTHTLFSMHAYGTVAENVQNAKAMGLEALGITDHLSNLFYPSTKGEWYGSFSNYHAIPKDWDGLAMFCGAEVDIETLNGDLFGYDIEAAPIIGGGDGRTISEALFPRLDYLIASIHHRYRVTGDHASLQETTKMYCNVLENPRVMILGHPGRAGVPFDYDEVLQCAKENHVMIEINDATLAAGEKFYGVCSSIAKRCAELSVPVCVNSDAHCSYYVGRYSGSVSMLEEIGFPEELIMNRSLETLKPFLAAAKPQA